MGYDPLREWARDYIRLYRVAYADRIHEVRRPFHQRVYDHYYRQTMRGPVTGRWGPP